MNYRTTLAADEDIIDLYARGVVAFGTKHAERYFDGLFSTFLLLADNPGMARIRTEIDPPMRLHRYRAHLIVYAEQEEGILIVRVLHGRQDWRRLLS